MRHVTIFVLACLVLAGILLIPVHAGRQGTFIDSVFGNQCTSLGGGNRTACSVLISTSQPTVLLAFPTYNFAGSCAFQPNNANVSDVQNLIWTERTAPSLFGITSDAFEYFAVSQNPLVNDNVTALTIGNCIGSSKGGIVVIGISGVNPNNPFVNYDNNPNPTNWAGAATNVPLWHVANVASPSITVQNLQGMTAMIVAIYAAGNSVAPAPSQGFTILTNTTSLFTQFAEYRTISELGSLILTFQNGQGPQTIIAEAILLPTSGTATPTGNFQSVTGPGGLSIPPQLADQNVLGYTFLLSAAIALSSIKVKREKKTERRLRLG